MIDRRRFLLTSLAGPFAAPLAAEAQPGTPPRIALALPAVLLGEMSRPDGASPALLRGLNELGYAEGQNIVIERRPSKRSGTGRRRC